MATKRSTPFDLPRITRPISAWALFNRIIKIIRTHPENFNMGWFKAERPACGTVCCIAGWGDVLLRSPQLDIQTFSPSSLGMYSALGARLATKVQEFKWSTQQSWQESMGLFYGYPEGLHGTPEYVESAISNIRRFMRENEKALKARTVKPGMTDKTYRVGIGAR